MGEARLYMGEWAAAFGRQEATHAGKFMGIAPTGTRVESRYMDFWKVVDGKIVYRPTEILLMLQGRR